MYKRKFVAELRKLKMSQTLNVMIAKKSSPRGVG